MKVTLALLMAAAISTLGFQAAEAQNAPYYGYANNGSLVGNLLNGLTGGVNYNADPYLNSGYNPYMNVGYGNGGNCGNGWNNNGNGWKNKRAKQIRKMQRKMARRAMQNGQFSGFNNGYLNNGFQNAGWGF